MKSGTFIRVRYDHPNPARAGKDGMVVFDTPDEDESVGLSFGFDRHNVPQHCQCVGTELWLKSELDMSTIG